MTQPDDRELLEKLIGNQLPDDCEVTINISLQGDELKDDEMEQVAGGARRTRARAGGIARFGFSRGKLSKDLSGLGKLQNIGSTMCW